MRRRTFLRLGAAAAAAPSLLSACEDAAPARAAGSGSPAAPPAGGPVRLAANENPLGLSPRARDAFLEAVARAHEYPFDGIEAFVEAVARDQGVPTGAVLPGNGSSEVLQVAAQRMAGPDGVLVTADPSFDTAELAATAAGATVRKIPLAPGGAHDLEAMESVVGTARGPVLVYVCNPNNPTATLTPVDGVEAWIRRAPEAVSFLVDEAYLDYVEDPAFRTLKGLAVERPGVVVARTFSKVHGLAGLRIGYGLAHPTTVDALRPWLSDINTNGPGLAAALAAMGDSEHVRRSLESNRRAKAVAEEVLDELGIARLPSHANFLMHAVAGDQDAYARRMLDAGFWVGRPFPPMLGHNRLSLGTPEQMARWGETLRGFRERGWA